MTEHTSAKGCIPKVVSSWNTFLSTLNSGHKIHPFDQNPPRDCEFIVIDSKIQIRVIHVSPGFIRKSVILSQPVLFDSTNAKRCSLSEEYWFNKWNKPLKLGNCNCSFRRSLRHSAISSQPSLLNAENTRKL